MKGQMISVDENEYNRLKCDSAICIDLIKQINEMANYLHPKYGYWIDVGSNADCAFAQLYVMFNDKKKKHKPYFERI